jgi:DNA polymerase-1
MLEAFRIPVIICDGFEADDLIGTLVRRAETAGFESYMVTPDKDFGQLVDEHTFIYKPGRMGGDVEIMGLPEIQKRWGIQKAEQVIDVLALMGDSSDNIPGVPGIGEKTATKLIGQYGSLENLLSHTTELTARAKDTLEKNREQALLSKRLATLICDAPCPVELDSLKLLPADDEKVKALLVEFEFNSIGRRLYGDSFRAGRGFHESSATTSSSSASAAPAILHTPEFALMSETAPAPMEQKTPPANLKSLATVQHAYTVVTSPGQRSSLIRDLLSCERIGLKLLTTSPSPKEARLLGIAFSSAPHTAAFVPLPESPEDAMAILNEFRPLLESTRTSKIGHDLKFDASVLKWHGVTMAGKLFDTMVAHCLVEPDMRHAMSYLAEVYLGYTPIPKALLEGGDAGPTIPPQGLTADFGSEQADLALQLQAVLEPLLQTRGQGRVFYDIESPLIPVLVDMEFEGIRVDATALADFGAQLAKEIDEHERRICQLAGTTFNLNSPRQLGQILFDVMKICEAPRKTKTGQYATDEQTLAALAPDHEIVRRLLEHRAATKLKSTYADALPVAIWPKTNRIHTTYNQVMTSTGRLNSQDPNLQNIPIRTDRGQEIRKAFVPRSSEYLLLSADYSQIELRIIAALSREPGLLDAFKSGADVHTATAAKVFGVFPEMVTSEMRRKAKMVNYGIAYGISAFGLAQRLGIARKEAGEIIDQYFKQFPGLRKYMDDTIAFARKQGYVETVTGRRRYIRDICSSNNTIRSAAERNAINAPIQGSAADMIKLAMLNIHAELARLHLQSRMLLQVHDELVFDLYRPEESQVRALVEDKMKSALVLDVPLVVELGVGENWLVAH